MFVVWMFLPVVDDPLTRVEIGYPLAALVLFISLFVLYETSTPKSGESLPEQPATSSASAS